MKNFDNKLKSEFYEREDVCKIAMDLLGKILVTNIDDKLTAGRIVETEAYNGPNDKAAHSYNNKRTNRTEVMFKSGGVVYIYLCYGLHNMVNIVTNVTDKPNAVLIRALEPVYGLVHMEERYNYALKSSLLTKGPGRVGKAMGLSTLHTGISLLSDDIFIADDDYRVKKGEIVITKRIGVEYALEDAELPYRFYIKGNVYVSGSKINNIPVRIM